MENVSQAKIKSMLVVSIGSLLGRPLALIREIVVAAIFGARKGMDAYVISMVPIQLIVDPLQGMTTNLIIPAFSKYLNKDGIWSGWRFVNIFLNRMMLFSILIISLLFILMPVVIHLIAPGFDTEAAEFTVKLSRLMLIVIIFNILHGIFTGTLHPMGHFVTPVLGPILSSVILLIIILSLRSLGILSMCIGTIIGSFAALSVLLFPVYKNGFRYSMIFKLTTAEKVELRHTQKALGFLMLATVFAQISLVVDRILASMLAEGSISALYYGMHVSQIPFNIFVVSIFTVAFPEFADFAAKDDVHAFKSSVISALRLIAFIMLPIILNLVIMRSHIVNVLLQRGAFDEKATFNTAIALACYAPGILFLGFDRTLSRAFYSVNLWGSRAFVVGVAVMTNVLLSIVLVRFIGLAGLALATSISFFVEFVVSIMLLSKQVGRFNIQKQMLFLGQLVLSCLPILGLSMYIVKYSDLSQIQGLMLSIWGGIVLYLGTAKLLMLREVDMLWNIVLLVWRRKRA